MTKYRYNWSSEVIHEKNGMAINFYYYVHVISCACAVTSAE